MGRHSDAVEKAIAAGTENLSDRHMPLLELCRVMASQVDASGEEGPGSRLAATYLSCLKDLSKVIGGGTFNEGKVKGKLAALREKRKQEDQMRQAGQDVV